MTLLHPGEKFPHLAVTPTDGAALELPDALAGHFGVVLFYRGAWCPYCNAQLRAFQRAADSLAEVDARVVALSVDDETTTAELVAKHGLTFPVGHSADAQAVAEATGAFVNPDPVLAVHRVPARPDRSGGGQRVLQRGYRPAGTRRRDRHDPLHPRPRPGDLHDHHHRDGDLRGRQLLFRPGVPVRMDDQQMAPYGHRPAELHGGLEVHFTTTDQCRGRLLQPLPARLRGRAHRRAAPAARGGPHQSRTRRRSGRPAVSGVGSGIFDTNDDGDRVDRGSAGFVEPVLAEVGLPAELVDALDDYSLDVLLRVETDEALALTGRDVGTPIIHFQPPAGVAFFGPVISRLPNPTTRPACGTTSSVWRVSRASPS